MKSDELSAEGSLAIITSVIDDATHRGKILKFNRYFLIFGWLGFLAGFLQFFLLKNEFGSHWIVWLIAYIISILVATVWGAKHDINDINFFGKLIMSIYQGFSIVVGLSFYIFQQSDIENAWIFAFTILSLLVAFSSWIVGSVFSFAPLKYGALLSFLVAILAILIQPQLVPIGCSLVILFSVLLPGYLMKKKYGKKA